MCGITGWIDSTRQHDTATLAAQAAHMARALRHRGPDDHHTWCDAETGVALGFQRLAILELSPQGRQPMASPCGRYILVFNGEIYNHASLRQTLELSGLAHPWRGRSDTEVLLAAMARWGVEKALHECVGMFALALWDRRERTLILARDRVGEKPLYYGWSGTSLLFASELKALRRHPAWNQEAPHDERALLLYLRHGWIPAPRTIHPGIFKLLPGTLLTFSWETLQQRRTPTPHPYWQARRVAEEGLRSPLAGTELELQEELERRLSEAVALQQVADVPLGAFLSGGIDSSLVVALMQSRATRPTRTFTIGFREMGYDESPHARAVARHLGTDHTEQILSPRDALELIPSLPGIFDEPFADPSQIPTLLVAQLARRSVTVALSGDGGDELFGGYARYGRGASLWRLLGLLPGRRALAPMLRRLTAGAAETLEDATPPWLARLPVVGRPLTLAHKGARLLGVASTAELYGEILSLWSTPELLHPGDGGSHLGALAADLPGFLPQAMFLDLVGYLPDDILVKVDRATMACGLEARAPFLDHRVVELAWGMPMALRREKRLLRRILKKFLPENLVERPKQGFSVPVGAWLKGALRPWAEELLAEKRLKQEGVLDARRVRAMWEQHSAGTRDWQHALWAVLMFQAWQQAQQRTVTTGNDLL